MQIINKVLIFTRVQFKEFGDGIVDEIECPIVVLCDNVIAFEANVVWDKEREFDEDGTRIYLKDNCSINGETCIYVKESVNEVLREVMRNGKK